MTPLTTAATATTATTGTAPTTATTVTTARTVTPSSTAPPPDPGSTARTRVHRLPEKAVTDRSTLHGVLDAGLVAHVAVADARDYAKNAVHAVQPFAVQPFTVQPFTLPVAYARAGETVLFHGSTASRLFRLCAAGSPVCFTVTLLDGLVLARSAFESSMNYRAAVVLGHCAVLHGPAKLDALERISEHLMPGRWKEIRHPSEQELRATTVLELGLEECSVKVSAGGPDDADGDVALPIWAGTVPLGESWHDPVPADDLSPEFASVPEYIRRWRR